MRARPILLAIALGGGGCDGGGGGGPGDAPGEGCEVRAPWASAPPLAFTTQETAAVAVDGKIYVLGGFDRASAAASITAVQVFDPAACAWSRGPDLPRAVHHVNAAVVDGTIYVTGALEGPGFTAVGDVWAWRPATDAGWAAREPMPAGTQRGSSVTAVIDGKIYVAGGLRVGAVTDASSYDPVADAWAPAPPLPQPRDHGCGGAVGGKLYVTGGRNSTIGSASAIVYELAPGGSWRERAPMPTARGGTACGVIGDRIVVAGGEGNPAPGTRGVFAEVEAYDAARDRWEPLAPMPTPRHGMGAAVWEGRLYVPGGGDRQGFGPVATFEVLTP